MPRSLPPLVLAALALGCGVDPPGMSLDPPRTPAQPPAAASTFDPAACGTISGRVTWSGPVPDVPGFIYGVPKGDGSFAVAMMPNPNRPAVDAGSKAVAGAAVFLRGVNPGAAKPWDLPPVRVEMIDRQIRVRQGDAAPRRVGFVRRGDPVAMASAEPVYHVLRGRGAAFFSLSFPDANQPLTRTFDQPGRVELSSGAGYYWASADLFVADHPYFALTDAAGRFTLDRVPAGEVELVAWHPGWAVARQERDPESGLVSRQTYGPPVVVVRKVTVAAGTSTAPDVTLP